MKICFVTLIVISNNYISFVIKYINIKFKYILNKLNNLLIYILIYIFKIFLVLYGMINLKII